MFAYSGENGLLFFIYYLFSPIVFSVGFIGNSLALIILRKKVMNKIGPIAMHYFLFAFDTLYLFLIFQAYLSRGFDINLLKYSRIGCKLFYHLIQSLAPMSPLTSSYDVHFI